VALEATTGWRFVVEELQRIGADVHLAEPAETSALKGKKKRAKTDWADVAGDRLRGCRPHRAGESRETRPMMPLAVSESRCDTE
jgi:hypothetical protein